MGCWDINSAGRLRRCWGRGCLAPRRLLPITLLPHTDGPGERAQGAVPRPFSIWEAADSSDSLGV